MADVVLEDLLNTVAGALDASVNLEVFEPALFHAVPSLKLGPRHHYHHGSYCHFAKVHGNQPACQAHKWRTLQLARRGRPRQGCCPFGVWEHLEPVFFEGRCVAMIYLGHFQADRPLLSIGGVAYDGPALTRISPPLQAQVQAQAGFIRQFIQWALTWARTQGIAARKQMPPAYYHRAALQYIQNHYHQPIRLEDLAGRLAVNPNYLGQVIAEQAGRTFRQMLRDHRIAQAKVHLSSEQMPVTQVAYVCGFQDGNYFSSVFQKATGLSPTAWRKRQAGE